MKPIIYGTGTVGERFGVSRDTIRALVYRGKISPSHIRMKGNLCYAFDGACQKKIQKLLKGKKKTGKSQSSSFLR